MADNSEEMKLSDLVEMLKGGASIKIERPLQRIAQFDELIAEMKNMIAGQKARADADLIRSQSQLEVLATLQSIIKNNVGAARGSPPLDLEPLQTVLTEIVKASHHEPVDYDFKILRTGPGMSPAHTIEARVVRSAEH